MLTINIKEDSSDIDFTYITKFRGSIEEFKNIVKVLATALTFEENTIRSIFNDKD